MKANVSPHKQELKRALGFGDLVVYGLVFMCPIAPFAIFGFVSEASGGMVALAFMIGMAAMFFTALSYKVLSRDFPMGGSVYTYAQRGIGDAAGFMAGWLMILDYLLCPALAYVFGAAALSAIFPSIPRWCWIVLFVSIGTITNYLGIQAVTRANKLFLFAQLVVVAIFVSLGLNALYHGAGAGHLTMAPLYRPQVFNVSLIFSAVSVSTLCFLGFDAISTLSEEVKGDSRKVVGNATMTALCLIGLLFIGQSWIAADLAGGATFASLDGAFYEIAAIAGGTWLAKVTAVAGAIMFGVAGAIVAQGAIARMLLAMARDRKLPAVLATIHPKHKTPHIGICVVAAISLAVALGFLNRPETLASFVNFGALSGFLILHLTVIRHFAIRQRSTALLQHVLSPILGILIIGYVLYSMGPNTWVLGLSWLAVGTVYYVILTRRRALSPQQSSAHQTT